MSSLTPATRSPAPRRRSPRRYRLPPSSARAPGDLASVRDPPDTASTSTSTWSWTARHWLTTPAPGAWPRTTITGARRPNLRADPLPGNRRPVLGRISVLGTYWHRSDRVRSIRHDRATTRKRGSVTVRIARSAADPCTRPPLCCSWHNIGIRGLLVCRQRKPAMNMFFGPLSSSTHRARQAE